MSEKKEPHSLTYRGVTETFAPDREEEFFDRLKQALRQMKEDNKKARRLATSKRRVGYDLVKEPYYMSADNILRDFGGSPLASRAIAAVFKWMSLNSSVAWRLKNGIPAAQ